MYNKKTFNRLNSYFINKLNMRPYRRGWLKGDCPSCGRPGKFGVNLFRDRTNCFVCEYHPKPITLIRELEDLDTYNEVMEVIQDYKEMEYIAPVIKEIDESKVVLPDHYINIALGDSRLARMARNYIRGRGFDIDDLSLKGWGYCTDGDYYGYIIIPFYMGGKLVYFNARKFFGAGPKYNNPTAEDSGIGKSIIIYNVEALNIYKEVFLMEGVINAETIGPEGIATGGKDISTKQLSIIKTSPVESMVLLLDPDAIERSVEIALDLIFYKKVKLVFWEGDKDVNDLGREETLKRVNAVNYSTYNELIKFKNRLKYAKGPVNSY